MNIQQFLLIPHLAKLSIICKRIKNILDTNNNRIWKISLYSELPNISRNYNFLKYNVLYRYAKRYFCYVCGSYNIFANYYSSNKDQKINICRSCYDKKENIQTWQYFITDNVINMFSNIIHKAILKRYCERYCRLISSDYQHLQKFQTSYNIKDSIDNLCIYKLFIYKHFYFLKMIL